MGKGHFRPAEDLGQVASGGQSWDDCLRSFSWDLRNSIGPEGFELDSLDPIGGSEKLVGFGFWISDRWI